MLAQQSRRIHDRLLCIPVTSLKIKDVPLCIGILFSSLVFQW